MDRGVDAWSMDTHNAPDTTDLTEPDRNPTLIYGGWVTLGAVFSLFTAFVGSVIGVWVVGDCVGFLCALNGILYGAPIGYFMGMIAITTAGWVRSGDKADQLRRGLAAFIGSWSGPPVLLFATSFLGL